MRELLIHLLLLWYSMHTRVISSYPIHRSALRYAMVGVILSAVLSVVILLSYYTLALIICVLVLGYVIMNIIRWSSLLLTVRDDGITIDHHAIPYDRIDWYRPIVYHPWSDADYHITGLVLSVDGVSHTFSFIDHEHVRHMIISIDAHIQRSDSYDDTRYDELLRGSKI